MISVLDHGFVDLLDHMGNDLTIVNAARVSFGKRKAIFDESDRKLLKRLLNDQHTSPFEHVHFTFHVKCPLFVARQWMRHRTWNYSEISRRYTSENIDFYNPRKFREQSYLNKQGSTDTLIDDPAIDFDYTTLLIDCYELYNRMLETGICREQARLILPQAMYTEFYATVDLHNLLKFLKLRLAEDAQYEISVYAKGILELIKDIVPNTTEIFMEDNCGKE